MEQLITVVYGPNDRLSRRVLWNEIIHIGNQVELGVILTWLSLQVNETVA